MSQFLSHTAVSSQGASRWQAEVHRGWRIGSVANGGYVLALLGRTLSEALNQPDPLSINAFYLAPVALGEVEVAVEHSMWSKHPGRKSGDSPCEE